MTYVEDLAAVVAAHRDEIAADLASARQVRERVGQALVDADRQVFALEHLLLMAASERDAAGSPGRLTLHAAMRVVLADAPGKRMRAADLAAEIDRRGLYRMRDGRPVEAQQIHARVGHNPDDFGREDTFIKLL